MQPTGVRASGAELDDFILAFEAAWARRGGGSVDLAAFLPEPGHPLFGPVLRELVRVDLEFRWDQGRPRSLEDYRDEFPELFRDREDLHAITFEEYRLRCEAGEAPAADEYRRRFGIDPREWPFLPEAPGGRRAAGPASPSVRPAEMDSRLHSDLLMEAARSYQAWCRDQPGGVDEAGNTPREDFEGSREHAGLSDEPHLSDTVVAGRLARAVAAMPRPEGDFLGFRLLAELGRGAFGRAYLARQGELADRLVVLKVVPDLFGESRALAQLQHTHIVPIYSVHRVDDFQVICMPFLGTTTLADVVADLRRRPAPPVSGGYWADRIEDGIRERPAAGAGMLAADGPASSRLRAPLEGMTYTGAVLWLAGRLADGLAHAHARGIIHRDLKPANILLTDEGRPMLLDFNLSEDTKLDRCRSAARIGGTLPYMAPEQLAALDDGPPRGDERSDLFSLGIILRELLTGQPPLARTSGSPRELLEDLRADRRLPVLRRFNPAVSPGVESIVNHCLEPDPSRRYQSAGELREDILRQLEDRPLKFAPDRSPRERARKWARRHPRLSSSTGVAAIALLLVLVMGGAFLLRVRHLSRLGAEQAARRAGLEAAAARHRLHDDLKTIEVLLASDVPEAEREQAEEGMALAQGVLDRYRVLESPAWQESPLVGALRPEHREQVRGDMGELLLLMAGASARRGQFDRSIRLNALAADCFDAPAMPRALWRQRADLARSTGHPDEARSFDDRAEEAPSPNARDRYLYLLTEYRHQGRLPAALPFLQEASRHQADNFSVWMLLGHCHIELGRPGDAAECYDMAGALWPEAPWPRLFRGMARLGLEDDRRALADFDEVIRLRPEMLRVYYDRALARFRLGDLPGARADLTHLLGDPRPPLRAYFLRARVREKQGDRAGARRDREDGLRGDPLDEQDLTARGLVRQPGDPRAALADYEAALKLNPRYLTALQNKASVLAEDLGRTEEAIAALDRLLALRADDVPAIAGRGVLRARLGRREAAHADAREAVRKDPGPSIAYQVAGIYALSSRQEPGDRREALRLLGSALDRGFGLDLVDRDPDLAAIRGDPEFRRLVEAARGGH